MKLLISFTLTFQCIFILDAGYVPNYNYLSQGIGDSEPPKVILSPLPQNTNYRQQPNYASINYAPISIEPQPNRNYVPRNYESQPIRNYRPQSVPQPNYNYQPPKVDVAVFYESHCPSCRKAFQNNLPEVVRELEPYINLKLYPYGFQEEVYNACNNSITYKCQHGPLECDGNLLHACAINVLQKPSVYMPYLSCLMSAPFGGKGSDQYTAQMCGSRLGLSETQYILACSNSPQSQRLIQDIGEVTKQASLSEVPSVYVNNRKVEESNLFSEICNAATIRPPACY